MQRTAYTKTSQAALYFHVIGNFPVEFNLRSNESDRFEGTPKRKIDQARVNTHTSSVLSSNKCLDQNFGANADQRKPKPN